MLNPFYWYSLIWTFIVILYDCNVSAINSSLSVNVYIFIWLTILISGVIGFWLRKVFRYKGIKLKKLPNMKITLSIVFLSLCEFIYAKQIPLFSIILRHGTYGDFLGIPILHPLLTNVMVFYSAYLFYIYLETKKRRILYQVIVQLAMFLLMFQKGIILICIFIIFNMMIAKLRKNGLTFDFKKIVYILCGILLIVYINGGLANIRSGVNWSNQTLVTSIGRIIHWPSWIPKQFCWAYIYVTSPLANLNYLLSTYNHVLDFGKIIVSVIPISISKQLFPNLVVSIDRTQLSAEYMNASSGFAPASVSGGVAGLWLFYFLVILIVLFLVWLALHKHEFQPVVYSICSMLVSFLFFYDTFSTATTSLLPVLIILFYILKRKAGYTIIDNIEENESYDINRGRNSYF